MSQVVDPSRWSSRCGNQGSVPPFTSFWWRVISVGISSTARWLALSANHTTSHPTARVRDIARIARDNVQMKMEDRLTGGRVFIEADVETIRPESLRDGAPGPDRLPTKSRPSRRSLGSARLAHDVGEQSEGDPDFTGNPSQIAVTRSFGRAIRLGSIKQTGK